MSEYISTNIGIHHQFRIYYKHRRTGNFLPSGGGGAVNLLPKKFSQVARILPKRTVEKKRGPHDATTEAALVYEGGSIL